MLCRGRDDQETIGRIRIKAQYWEEKLVRNFRRDGQVNGELRSADPVVFWFAKKTKRHELPNVLADTEGELIGWSGPRVSGLMFKNKQAVK